MLSNPTLWVAAGMAVFFGLLAYKGVFASLARSLDDRAAVIERELNEASALRREAEALLASYAAKRKEAEAEAKAIVKQAKADADALLKDAEARLTDLIARRTASVEDKIQRAEQEAFQNVKMATVDAAASLAEVMMQQRFSGKAAQTSVDAALAVVKDRFH